MQTVSFQVPETLNKQLTAFAKKMDRSKGYLMRQALEEYLEDLRDYTDALRYKAEYDPKENISFEDVKRKLGLK